MVSNKLTAGFAAFAMVISIGVPLESRANLIQNGGFESYTPNSINPGDLTYTPVTGWSSPALNAANTTTGNLLYFAGTGDTTGSWYSPGSFFGFWGPNNNIPVNNGFTAASPAGGNYLGLDADPLYNGAVSQLVTGLTPGAVYQLGFYWAGAQLWYATGATTEQLQVSLGGQTQSTNILNTPSQGFSPWGYQTFNFTASNASETLSFLAVGGPGGLPPFVLLDGVTLNAVPEPSTVALATLGLFGLGVSRRLRRLTKV